MGARHMIVTISAILGALFGFLQAKKRGGSGLDLAQYAGAYALVFGIVALVVTTILMRLMG